MLLQVSSAFCQSSTCMCTDKLVARHGVRCLHNLLVVCVNRCRLARNSGACTVTFFPEGISSSQEEAERCLISKVKEIPIIKTRSPGQYITRNRKGQQAVCPVAKKQGPIHNFCITSCTQHKTTPNWIYTTYRDGK